MDARLPSLEEVREEGSPVPRSDAALTASLKKERRESWWSVTVRVHCPATCPLQRGEGEPRIQLLVCARAEAVMVTAGREALSLPLLQ